MVMNDLLSQPINFLYVDLSFFKETFVSENYGSVELEGYFAPCMGECASVFFEVLDLRWQF